MILTVPRLHVKSSVRLFGALGLRTYVPLDWCVRDDKVPLILTHWRNRSEPDVRFWHIVLRSYFSILQKVFELCLSISHTLLGTLFVRVLAMSRA